MSDGNGNAFWKTVKPFMTDKGISSSSTYKNNESIDSVIERHSNHPSVVNISQSFNVIDTFEFTTVSEVQVEKQIKSVNPKKATGYDQIPPRIIKLCHKELTPALTKIINNSITMCFSIRFKES